MSVTTINPNTGQGDADVGRTSEETTGAPTAKLFGTIAMQTGGE